MEAWPVHQLPGAQHKTFPPDRIPSSLTRELSLFVWFILTTVLDLWFLIVWGIGSL